jgi:2,3-diketo-5-methylthio-1-phosphopentane phosphatase
MSEPLQGVRSIVIDFDGTICEQDVSEEILQAFGSPGWLDIDLAFQRGAIGSRECLVRQSLLLRGRQDHMLEYALSKFSIDPTFPPFVSWAQGVGVEVTVASDGYGFYVEPMLRAGGSPPVAVMTNRFSMVDGLPALAFPNRHPECVGCGTCKMRAVKGARDRRGRVAFAGEGHSDRYGALYADVVFAKKHLVDICRADGIPYLPWTTFDDVRGGLETLATARSDGRPDRCPGWLVPG